MSFTTVLALGAFLLAVWVDARLDGRRPQTPKRRIAHVAASCVVLQLAAVGAGVLLPEDGSAAARVTAVCAVVLPALVYVFLSGLWLIRTLAEVAVARR